MKQATSGEDRVPRQANKRGAARLAAVQALYQMDVAGSGLLEITAEYESFRLGKEIDGAVYREADAQWFRSILAGVVQNQKVVDPVIHDALTEDWPLSRLDSTLRAIMRAGVYELMERRDVPVAVIVSRPKRAISLPVKKLGANIAMTCHEMPSAASSGVKPQPTMASGAPVMTKLIRA